MNIRELGDRLFKFVFVIDKGEYSKKYDTKHHPQPDGIEYKGELYRKSNHRAGFDIVQHEDINIPPKQISKIKTNVRFPNGIGNNFALVTLRSSYQNSGLMMPAIGILDSDYTDYIFITIFNRTKEIIKIEKGNRFGQLVFIKNNDIELKPSNIDEQ